jgi:hypothetical protein
LRPSFIYYLFSKNKAPLYVDANGHVLEGDPGNYFKPDGQPARLKHSPDGWKDTLVKYARNIKYWGLFRDYSVPMNFVGDGRRILRDQFYKYGSEAVVYLGIAKLDRSSVPYNYTSWYISELDFSKYEETKTGIKVMAVEGGLTKFIKSFENTVYEIPIDTDPEKIFVKDDGVVLTEKSNHQVVDGFEITKSDHGTEFFMPFIFINREGRSSGITFQDQNMEDISGVTYADKLLSSNWCAKAADTNTSTIILRVRGQLTFDCNQQDAALGFIMRFLRSNLDIGSQNDYRFFNESPLVAGETYNVPVSIDIPLQPGERLYLEGIFGSTGSDIKIVFDQRSILSFEYEGRYGTTYIAGLYPYRVLEVLLNKMTNGQHTVAPGWLQNKKDIVLTSGFGIRNLPNKVIKTSLADFFKAMGIFSVGLTVKDEKLVIDQLATFFTSDEIVDLGEVDDIQITPADDISFNTIKTGYKQQEYNDVNGKYEFNQGQQKTTPKLRNVKELDLISPYRADPIGIELLRLNYDSLNTTDAKDDNDVFMLNVETVVQVLVQTVDFVSAGNFLTNPGNYPFTAGNLIKITGTVNNNGIYPVVAVGTNIVQIDPAVPIIDETGVTATITFLQGGVVALNRPTFSNLSGIPETMEDSIYNVLLSPTTNLLNNGGLIHSILDLMDSDVIKFQSADQNADLSYTFLGNTVTEKADIQIGGLTAKHFKPYYIDLRTIVPINVIELINKTPFGKVKFQSGGKDYYFFLWDGGIAPAKAGKDNDAQQWKGLSAPESDLSKIYNY